MNLTNDGKWWWKVDHDDFDEPVGVSFRDTRNYLLYCRIMGKA